MKIKSLKCKNFKGLKNFDMAADCSDVNIYGANGSGKTTIFDAFTWLLFDKDSLNKNNFNIKTLDKDGEPVHGLDHEVEAVFDIDGKEIALKKIYREKWTKTRGSAKKTFSGHTTDYFVNDVPVKKSEYQDRINEIADESIFRLMADPLYFNQKMHWTDRRKLLLEVCGNITDGEVIESNKKLAKLESILGDRSIEEHKKVIAAKRRKINEQLDKIPTRIDEVESSIPDIGGIDFDVLESTIEDLEAKKDKLKEDITRINSGGEMANKKKLLAEVESNIINMQNKHEAKKQDALNELWEKVSYVTTEYTHTEGEISHMQSLIDLTKKQIATLDDEITALRNRWHTINAETFEFSQDPVCPTCGQDIPEDQLAEAREKALKAFNQNKSQKLEDISLKGKTVSQELKDKKLELEKLEVKQEELQEKLKQLKTEKDKLNKQIKKTQDNIVDLDLDPAYKKELARKKQLQKVVDSTKESKVYEIDTIKDNINAIDSKIRELQSKFAKKEQARKAQKRIMQLEDEEQKLAETFEKLEEELYLTEQFIITKVNLLEEKINSKFNLANFKLFNTLINGAVEECCETVYNGVPYSDMNNAARINIGLDIINTLSDYYNFSAPIFIDNREAVTQIIDTKGQVISLIVSEKDKDLKVEVDTEQRKLKEAI